MNPNRIVWGTCDGTAAVINVCLGFIPNYVKVWNLEDGHSKWPSVEWHNPNFRAVTLADEGVLDQDDGSQVHRDLLAADGISVYSGGDKIEFLSVTHPHWVDVGATVDVSEKYVDGHYKRDASTDTAFKSIGDSLLGKTPAAADYGVIVTTTPGFKIGVNGDLNADGEQLIWMAIG